MRTSYNSFVEMQIKREILGLITPRILPPLTNRAYITTTGPNTITRVYDIPITKHQSIQVPIQFPAYGVIELWHDLIVSHRYAPKDAAGILESGYNLFRGAMRV